MFARMKCVVYSTSYQKRYTALFTAIIEKAIALEQVIDIKSATAPTKLTSNFVYVVLLLQLESLILDTVDITTTSLLRAFYSHPTGISLFKRKLYGVANLYTENKCLTNFVFWLARIRRYLL